jgi:hypothetical protein
MTNDDKAKPTFPFTLKCWDRSERTFANHEDLERFVQAEREQWQWLQQGDKDELRKSILPLFEGVQNALPGAKASGDYAKVREELGIAFQNRRLPLTGSPSAVLLSQLAKKYGPRTARGALEWFMGVEGSDAVKAPDQGDMGRTFAVLHKHSPTEEHKKACDELYAQTGQALERINAQGKDALAQLESLHTSKRVELDDLRRVVEEKFAQLEQKYREIQELKEPAAYWKEEGDRYSSSSNMYFWAAIVLIVAATLALTYWSYKAASAASSLTGATPSFWSLFPFYFPIVVAALAVVWIIRVLLRLFVTHRHLATDAHERITLAKTFLAMRERDEIKPEVMEIVAQQLFRQAGTGLVKGDDMPKPIVTKVLEMSGKP